MRTEALARARHTGPTRFLVPLALLLFVAARIELRLDYLETAYTFYAWLLARETERSVLIPVTAVAAREVTEESAFFEKVRASLDEKTRAFAEKALSDLDESQLWKLVLLEMKLPTRWEFEALARKGKLNLPFGAIEWTDETVGAHLGTLILGFRSAVADLLWLKVDDYWHQGRMEMMLPIMYTVVKLDPHFIDAWSTGAWHLAYNAAVTVDTPEAKQAFIDKAIVFLQDGIKRNPHHYELYFELGFRIYYMKLADYKNAAHYLERSTLYKHPQWVDRMLLHAYEQGGEYEKALEGWRTYLAEIDPDSLVAPRFILQLQAEIAEREGDEDRAFGIWKEIFDKFPGVNERADIGIGKIEARRAESRGEYDKAIAIWQSFIDKRYPSVYDEALENIARLNVLKLRSSGAAAGSEG